MNYRKLITWLNKTDSQIKTPFGVPTETCGGCKIIIKNLNKLIKRLDSLKYKITYSTDSILNLYISKDNTIIVLEVLLCDYTILSYLNYSKNEI